MVNHAHQQSQYHSVENFDAQSVEMNLWESLLFICMQKINFITNFFFRVL